ncbi:nitrate assimilation regulatory protein nirA [Coccidioides immitis H538.4]|uniref:Nitrate assimilation regulatory protein nirA n=1 Tax=Coccidioides immitis H538.4 TaxID=396776 RepID=A0A0J8RV48_COCIT|nr:nitrate assimilation regulatory protein nirA [Coccidioides immitis H538.4]
MADSEAAADVERTAVAKQRVRQSGKQRSKLKNQDKTPAAKRRCVSTACIACRKRKSKNRNTTLQTLVEAILNYDEDDVLDLVRQMRSSDDLEAVAESILTRQSKKDGSKSELPSRSDEDIAAFGVPQFESELAGRISELKLDGTVKYVGGTSNLIFLPASSDSDDSDPCLPGLSSAEPLDDSIRCWTTVTKSKELIRHLLTMYFTWHYPYFTTLSKRLFYRDFVRGRPSEYCSALLVNAMLALGCHFSSWPATREDPNDSATAGDHFFREAKRLILEHDEHEKARLCNVQAFAIMSVREAGCGREGSGWVYSGMSFRMAYDLGLNVDATGIGSNRLNDQDIDARRITFWGCYLFDKCWSNYLGRQPQLSGAQITVPKVDVFPDEDSEMWSPYTDVGVSQEHVQPARTRAVALQISKLCEISSDLLSSFYNPIPVNRHMGKQEELRRLSQLHTRLEAWRKDLPKEMEPKDGQLPQVLLMHMFFQLLFIHLYRPFLKYTKATSPLPQHVSPRKLCTQSASMISKLLRIYKRSYNLRQICNVAKWHIALPAEATAILERSHAKFGSWASWDQVHSSSTSDESTKMPSQEAPSIPSTRGSSPDENLKSVQAHPQPAGTPLQVMPQFAQAFRPVSQKSAIHRSQSVKDFQCNPSLPEPPPKPSCYTDVDIQPKLEDSGSPPILTVTDTSSTSLEAPQIPAFAEIDNLVEESQDWWFKDQNALALGLDNWDWGSPDGACGDIDVERTMPPTSTPTPSFGENPHLIPGQVTGVISPNIGVHNAPHAYSGGYYVPESTPDSINVTQPFTGPPSEPGIHTPNQMYY